MLWHSELPCDLERTSNYGKVLRIRFLQSDRETTEHYVLSSQYQWTHGTIQQDERYATTSRRGRESGRLGRVSTAPDLRVQFADLWVYDMDSLLDGAQGSRRAKRLFLGLLNELTVVRFGQLATL